MGQSQRVERAREKFQAMKLVQSYTFMSVALDDIFVDHRYQRQILPFQVKRIRTQYNPMLFQPPVLSSRNSGEYTGKYAAIDGQQRIEGLRQAIEDGAEAVVGTTHIECIVHTDLTTEEEALLFWWLNAYQSKLTPVAEFKGRLHAKDEVALAIHAAMKKYGLAVPGIDSEAEVGWVKAVRSAEDVYIGARTPVAMDSGPDVLDKTLNTLASMWPGEANAFAGDMIRGMGMFFGRFPDIEVTDVVREVGRRALPEKILEEAGKLQRYTRGQEKRAYSIGQSVMMTYNQSRESGRYLRWPIAKTTRGWSQSRRRKNTRKRK